MDTWGWAWKEEMRALASSAGPLTPACAAGFVPTIRRSACVLRMQDPSARDTLQVLEAFEMFHSYPGPGKMEELQGYIDDFARRRTEALELVWTCTALRSVVFPDVLSFGGTRTPVTGRPPPLPRPVPARAPAAAGAPSQGSVLLRCLCFIWRLSVCRLAQREVWQRVCRLLAPEHSRPVPGFVPSLAPATPRG